MKFLSFKRGRGSGVPGEEGGDGGTAFSLDGVYDRSVAGRVLQYPGRLFGGCALRPQLAACLPNQIPHIVRGRTVIPAAAPGEQEDGQGRRRDQPSGRPGH